MDPFGSLKDGRQAHILSIANANGLTARITDYGAALVSLEVPDRDGQLADVTLGFDSVEGYASDANPYFGASVGRYGNRIAKGVFRINGNEYRLDTNNDPAGIPCHLHGGSQGLTHRLWVLEEHHTHSATFRYDSPNGEEGYPGNLTVRVTYTLTDNDELVWEATATSDAPCPINLVHHSYWNLTGHPGSTTEDHILTLHADRFLPTDQGMIPTGETLSVEGTPMDFTSPVRIGERSGDDFESLHFGAGYDHCWVLRDPGADGLRHAARLHDPSSGRTMDVLTNQPGIQFYGGNWVHVSSNGKNGASYPRRSGCALETENFPDSPNQPNFPNCILQPGETYHHRLIHRFSAH